MRAGPPHISLERLKACFGDPAHLGAGVQLKVVGFDGEDQTESVDLLTSRGVGWRK